LEQQTSRNSLHSANTAGTWAASAAIRNNSTASQTFDWWKIRHGDTVIGDELDHATGPSFVCSNDGSRQDINVHFTCHFTAGRQFEVRIQ
jgi:hypothetical protein